jgi:hypothetical protein
VLQPLPRRQSICCSKSHLLCVDAGWQAPIVLPFYHTGMHRVLPQVPGSKRQLMPPKIGNTLRMRVGEPIEVQDLIDGWREKRAAARAAEGITDGWTTTEVDEELYDLITARVETALVKLGQEVDQDAEWQPHLSVLPFMRRTPSADKDA